MDHWHKVGTYGDPYKYGDYPWIMDPKYYRLVHPRWQLKRMWQELEKRLKYFKAQENKMRRLKRQFMRRTGPIGNYTFFMWLEEWDFIKACSIRIRDKIKWLKEKDARKTATGYQLPESFYKRRRGGAAKQ